MISYSRYLRGRVIAALETVAYSQAEIAATFRAGPSFV